MLQDKTNASPRRSRSASCRDRNRATEEDEEDEDPLFTRQARPIIIGFAPPKTEFGTDVFHASSGQHDLPLATQAVDQGRWSAPSPCHYSGQNEQAAAGLHPISQNPQHSAIEWPQEPHRPSAPLPFANRWDRTVHDSPSGSLSDPDPFVRESSMQQWRRLNRDCAASVPPAASLSFQPVDLQRRSNSAPPYRATAPHEAPTPHYNDEFGVYNSVCAPYLACFVSEVPTVHDHKHICETTKVGIVEIYKLYSQRPREYDMKWCQ